MRRLLLTLGLLFIVGPCWAQGIGGQSGFGGKGGFGGGGVGNPIAFVQVNSSTTFCDANFSTANCTYSINNTAGNTGFLVLLSVGTSSQVTISDTNSNTWNLVLTCTETNQNLFLYEAVNINAGANTVHIAAPASRFRGFASEYSGLGATAALDQSGCNQGSSATATVTAGGATTQPNELVIGWFWAAGPLTVGAGYTQRANDGTIAIYEDNTVSSTGTYTATATLGFGAYSAMIATLK